MDQARSSYLADFALNRVDEHEGSDIYASEVTALRMWMSGDSFETIAASMPTFGGTGLFGSSEEHSRIADVAEYVSRIGYPGSWSWAAAQTLAEELYGIATPGWISSAVEYGASNECAANLMRLGNISRPGALHSASVLGPSWAESTDELINGEPFYEGLSPVDDDRLAQLRFLLREDAL